MTEEIMLLVPCPFCGQLPVLSRAGEGVVFACINEDCLVEVGTKPKDTQNEAMRAWNTRIMRLRAPRLLRDVKEHRYISKLMLGEEWE